VQALRRAGADRRELRARRRGPSLLPVRAARAEDPPDRERPARPCRALHVPRQAKRPGRRGPRPGAGEGRGASCIRGHRRELGARLAAIRKARRPLPRVARRLRGGCACMSRFEDPVIITNSISGTVANRDQCPAIPYTPEEYAAEARRVVDEGGSMIHIHARTPDGTPSYEIQDFRRSEEHTSELQSQSNLVCRLLLEKK